MNLEIGARSLAWGAYLNMAGVAVGIVVFLAHVYIEVAVDKGTLPVLRQMLEQLEKMPANKTQFEVFSDMQWWLETHEETFSVLGDRSETPRGKRTDAVWVGAPTWWKAAKMGFSPAEIALLFDAGHVEVAATLVGVSPRWRGTST